MQWGFAPTRMEQGAQELSVRTAAVRAEWSALVREITEMVGATVAVPKATVYPALAVDPDHGRARRFDSLRLRQR